MRIFTFMRPLYRLASTQKFNLTPATHLPIAMASAFCPIRICWSKASEPRRPSFLRQNEQNGGR
ncbi:hypothetical protein D1AOALGA4SA_682 [Olavius algarvensis Delta 1 endosymbiont]|nr:hypothetical protein D1AOALGA4SA_682 [Olavius algarvensis Delta 1 endosymbiont]